MGDEFQAGICSGNWWNSSRSGVSGGSCSSPCSTVLNDMGSFGWGSEARSSCEETTAASVSDSSMVFQHTQKQQIQTPVDSIGGGGGGSGGGGILMDSTLQMMGFGPSSLTMDWNQALLNRGSGGRSEETNFHSMLQDELSSRPNFKPEMGMESPPTHRVQRDWSPKSSFSGVGEDSSSLNAQINQVFPMDHHQQLRLNSSSADCTVSSQGIPSSFPSFGCNSPALLQGLFDAQETQLQLQQHQQQSTFETHRSISNPSPNYRINNSEFASPLPSWAKFPAFLKTSPPKQQQQYQHQPSSQFHFTNNAPYWNASAAPMNDARSSFFPSPHTQFLSTSFEEKPSCSSLTTLTTTKSGTEEVRDSGSVAKKGNSEPAYKRPRIETPSPLPTFKVRKEKLGDRITALQQLVSPFGKTDTASVLFEAIEYIKFLHEQVLSTPYMKNGAPTQHQQSSDKLKDGEGPKQDLRSRGLCLVPISSTFPVTNETAADFWTPTFGETYR
ncbi:transcription factor bHLH123-like isoform X2 [Macadamia integrifolia]|uniref:transcription factor bHLH123-like isoform X2 n=1 Tax=Macadamia integrifolia TaxID=60698 RepID=UPI001C4F95BC|nr:transcription factor bHLH123-like isoform X2 [Macadamia integrifolia]